MIAYKNGQTSIVLRVKLMDSSSTVGAGLTGLTSSSAGLIISTIADNEASATAYTQAGSTIEAVTTLGTYAAPTATKCRFKEVDATNHKGIYEIQIADARFAVSSAKSLLISISGATNLAQCDYLVPLVVDDPYVAKLTDKTGYSLSQSFPANFASLAISSGGHISNVDTLTTYTGDTPQTGDAYTRIGAAGAGLTALGDTRIAHLDADVSSRSTFAGGAVASVTGNVGGNVTGSVGSIVGITFPTHFSSMAIDVSGNVTFGNTSIGTVTTLTNLPAIPANWLTAAGIAAAALNGKGDWNVGKTGYSISGTITTLDALGAHGDSSWATATGFATPTNITAGTITTVSNLTNAPTSGDFTAAMKTSLSAATPAVTVSDKTGFSLASAYDPAKTAAQAGDAMTLTVAYDAAKSAASATTAAAIKAKTDNLPAAPADESLIIAATNSLATSIAALPTTATVNAIKAKTDNLPASPAAVGSAMTLSGAYDAAKTAATQTSADAIKLVTDNLSGMLEDSTGFRFTTHALEQAPTGGATAPTAVEIRQEMDSNSTRLAAIETVTDGLPNFVHTAGKLWTLDGNGNAIAPASQTQAIQAKTDNLPSDPADESLIIAATGSLATAIAALPTTSTVMAADIKKVNGVTIGGNGAGAPWGPA